MQQKKGRKKVKLNSAFIITSLMDVFTILLLYLMKSYSAEGSILSNAENLVLPNSISDKRPDEATLQITVAKDMVLVDNVLCCPTDMIKNIPQDVADPVPKKLYDRLEEKYKEIEKQNKNSKVEGKITIQIDKSIDFDTVYKIMNTCGKVGFNDMNFAVMARNSD